MTRHRGIASYARPEKIADRPTPIAPTPPFPPLRSAPDLAKPPYPPRPPVAPVSGWNRSDHVLHAAYPRSFRTSTGDLVRESEPYEREGRNESKEQRMERVKRGVQKAVELRHGAEYVHPDDDTPGLYLAAERWKRESGGANDGLTLIITHANGFTKETWQPTVRRLLDGRPIPRGTFGNPPVPIPPIPQSTLLAPESIEIDEIWLLDDIHHGASIDVNAGRIGPVHSWVDGGRDIISAIEQVTGKAKSRKFIGIGHSFGGNAIEAAAHSRVHAAHARPDLFNAILLVDPMCPPVYNATPDDSLKNNRNLASGALKRRGQWPDLNVAASVRDSPFFKSWHDEVWDLWLSHGLVPNGHGEGVQLATPKWGEAAVFVEPEGLGQGWDKLPLVRVPVGFIMAGLPIATHGQENTREMVWRPPVSANEIFEDAGHLVVLEKPDEVADAIRRFIGNVMLPRIGAARL